MRFLCISDIHGRLDALSAVLASGEKLGFQEVLVAGDILFPGKDAIEVWRRLSSLNARMVSGLTDRAIAMLDEKKMKPSNEHEEAMLRRMLEIRSELGDVLLERVRRLPERARFDLESGGEILLVHGSPRDPSEAISIDLSDDEMNNLVGDDPADIVVCGMSHVPFDKTLPDVRIINVGSVGEAPPDGSYAHATWIDSRKDGIYVEQMIVPL